MIQRIENVLPDFKLPAVRKPKEGKVVKACIDWLFRNGCYAWRNNTGAYKTERGDYIRYGLKGSSDILAVNPRGRMVCVECKATTRQKPEQAAFQQRIEEKQGVYVLAYGIDDLEARKGEILA